MIVLNVIKLLLLGVKCVLKCLVSSYTNMSDFHPFEDVGQGSKIFNFLILGM